MKDGGPAFPFKFEFEHPDAGPLIEHSSGMSLRDWFAGMALQGVISLYKGGNEQFESYRKDMVEVAYQLADAMLKERENGS